MKDPELSHEARQAIRNYLVRLIGIPGGIFAVVMFFLGYFIQDIAVNKANNDAYKDASKYVQKLSNDIYKIAYQTKLKAEETDKFFKLNIDKFKQIEVEISQLEERVKNEISQLEMEAITISKRLKTAKSFQESENIVKAVSDSLIARKDFIDNVVRRSNATQNEYVRKVEKNGNTINRLSKTLEELSASLDKLNTKLELDRLSSIEQESDLSAPAVSLEDLGMDTILDQPEIVIPKGFFSLSYESGSLLTDLFIDEDYSDISGLELKLVGINKDKTANVQIKTLGTEWKTIKNIETGMSCQYQDVVSNYKIIVTDIDSYKISIMVERGEASTVEDFLNSSLNDLVFKK